MSRISERFSNLASKDEGALVCFVTAGDPDMQTTHKIITELEQAGADAIEVGIPFSDPIADGTSIQASYMRSLENETNIPDVLNLVSSIRMESQIPLILMTYYNPVMKYGIDKFASEAASAGVDGVILTDMIPEESDDWLPAARKVGLDTIFLLAPTSTEERIKQVAKLASGFIYCVSRTGVTGARMEMAYGVRDLVDRIRNETDKPIAVGFGISKPVHVHEVCEYADGAVVGSLLVNIIAGEKNVQAMLSELSRTVSALKAGSRRDK